MNRLLTILLLVLALVACDNKEPDHNIKSIKIVGDSEVWVAGNGENTYEIVCKLLGDSERPILEATTNNEWIDIVSCGSSIIWYKPQKNDTGDIREGSITISCADESCELYITQRPYATTEFHAMTIHGSTYNVDEESDAGMYNYNLVLSSEGVDKSGYLYQDSEYYILNLYSSTPASGEKSWTLPQDVEIDLENSYYIMTGSDAASSYEVAFKEAKISVGEKMIEAHVVLDDDKSKSVNVWYRGALYQNMSLYPYLSTLEADYTFDYDDAIFSYEHTQDNICMLYIVKQIEGENIDIFQLSLQLPEGSSDIVGTYQRGDATSSFISGGMSDDNKMYVGSWFMKYDDTERAPMVDGKIEISKNESDTYTFIIDVKDDANHKIKGSIDATMN